MKKTNIFGLSVILIYIILCAGAWMTTLSCEARQSDNFSNMCFLLPGILSLPTVLLVRIISEIIANVTKLETGNGFTYTNIVIAQLINLYYLSRPYFIQRKQSNLTQQ
jgi:hypothetical protein